MGTNNENCKWRLNMQETTNKDQESAQQQIRLQERMSQISHKLMVMSGKGGVGKSTVAVNLASGLADQGYRVGVLDVDIHGPNIPKMLGIEMRRVEAHDGGIVPIEVGPNLKAISIALVGYDRDTPFIWRGPLKMGVIRQFLADVEWGALDFLIVDSPPGTGDEPLSVGQLIPDMRGSIIVTTPQEVSILDSRKCINFSKQLDLPVLGVIENMSGFLCPHCGEVIELFGKGGGKRAAEEMGVPFLGAIPIEPSIVVGGDTGKPFVGDRAHPESSKAFEEIVGAVVAAVGTV
jgi:Mrp family chromosome partitioning ATPase